MRKLTPSVLALLCTVLIACTSIPTSGPVLSTERSSGVEST